MRSVKDRIVREAEKEAWEDVVYDVGIVIEGEVWYAVRTKLSNELLAPQDIRGMIHEGLASEAEGD